MPKKSRFGLSAWVHAPSTRKRNSKNILNQELPIIKTVAAPGAAIPVPGNFADHLRSREATASVIHATISVSKRIVDRRRCQVR